MSEPRISQSRGFKLEIDKLQIRARNLCPALANIEFSNSWAGPIAVHRICGAAVRHVASCERILVAGAYVGHRVALSVRVGELLANAIGRNESLSAWDALSRRN